MNKKEIRMRSELMNLLKEKESVSTRDASERLCVSESSIRRLFDKMQADGEVVRMFGGVRLVSAESKYRYDVIKEQQFQAKTLIGKEAASMISDNEFIYIDCGTTTIHLCEYIVERVKHGELTGVTVVTNSLTNLDILNRYCSTILASGIYNSDRKSFSGALCESFISQFHFSKVFLGADGLSLSDGFSTSGIESAHLSGIAASLAGVTYVLLDSSKLNKRSFVVYDKFENIKNIITDTGFDSAAIEELCSKGVKVIISK